MVNAHRASIRRKKVQEIKYMVFKKGGTFEHRNGFVEKSIENGLRYYTPGAVNDSKKFNYLKRLRQTIIKNEMNQEKRKGSIVQGSNVQNTPKDS